MAFGTNDTNLTVGARPRVIVDAYREAWEAAERSGLDVFVALAPPRYNFSGEPIRALNDGLRATFPADRLIDFYSIVDSDDFVADGIHVRAASQHERAREAYRVLTGGDAG